jgi:hypothetical protein
MISFRKTTEVEENLEAKETALLAGTRVGSGPDGAANWAGLSRGPSVSPSTGYLRLGKNDGRISCRYVRVAIGIASAYRDVERSSSAGRQLVPTAPVSP